MSITASGIADPAIPLPHIPPDPTLGQIADFLQFYAAMDTDTLAAAISARYPHLRLGPDAKHAMVTGWLGPQMDHAAFALRQYEWTREARALGQTA